MGADETNEQIAEGLTELYLFLSDNGVPESSLADLRSLVEEEKHIEALIASQEYSKCFPYMKHSTLVFQIAALWELLSAKYQYVKDKCTKKIVALTADSKTEPEVMDAAQAKREDAAKLLQRSNIKLYVASERDCENENEERSEDYLCSVASLLVGLRSALFV